MSLSARRAWIEMPKELNRPPPLTVALRKESVDRNIKLLWMVWAASASLSARRAWIEIGMLPHSLQDIWVALRKESVDRNIHVGNRQLGALVALRKESVDRNLDVVQGKTHFGESLSARRAWIEICS